MKYLDLIKEKLSLLWPMWLVIMSVATWSIYIQDGQINRDGLLYLKQAYLIADGSWKEGFALYPWPFFSILIAVFHKITNLNLQLVAHGVDLALFGVASLFYFKTLQLIYEKEKQILFYGGIILLSFIPIMDDYIGMVLRDHGLWAGCMMGTYFYLKSIHTHYLKNSIFWQISFLIAGLFRPEGLIILVLLPIWNFSQNNSQKLKKLILDYSLITLLAIFSLFAIFLLNIDLMNVISSSRLTDFLDRLLLFLNRLIKPLPIQSDNIFFSKLLEDYSLLMIGASLLTILIFKWIKGLGLLHGGLLFYSIFKQKNLKNIYQKHLYFLVTISFILVSINLFTVYVLSNRYWGFHWFWIFMLITPVLLNIFKFKRSKKNDILKILISSYISLSVANIFLDSNKTNVELEAANYLSSVTKIHNKSVKFINAERVGYYGGISIQRLINSDNPSSNTDFLIFKGNNNEAIRAAGSDYQLDKSFIKDQQGVFVFRRKSSD